jgi:hypothetical protein
VGRGQRRVHPLQCPLDGLRLGWLLDGPRNLTARCAKELNQDREQISGDYLGNIARIRPAVPETCIEKSPDRLIVFLFFAFIHFAGSAR